MKVISQSGGLTEKPNIEGIDKGSIKKSANNSVETLLNLVINVFV